MYDRHSKRKIELRFACKSRSSGGLGKMHFGFQQAAKLAFWRFSMTALSLAACGPAMPQLSCGSTLKWAGAWLGKMAQEKADVASQVACTEGSRSPCSSAEQRSVGFQAMGCPAATQSARKRGQSSALAGPGKQAPSWAQQGRLAR